MPDKDNILDVEILTGLPVDYEVLSKFCHQCLKAPAKDDIMFEEWQAEHVSKCGENYEGSANSMEQECATLIWQRSGRKTD